MRRAFTLLESVIASVTLGLAMTMLMMLVHQYLRVTRQSQQQLEAFAPRLRLLELGEEARLAIEVLEPLPGAQSSRLVFRRVRPAALPVVGLDPWPATRQMTVTLQTSSQELWREWEWSGQPAQRELVVAPCRRFQASQPEAGQLLLRLNEFEEKLRLWRE